MLRASLGSAGHIRTDYAAEGRYGPEKQGGAALRGAGPFPFRPDIGHSHRSRGQNRERYSIPDDGAGAGFLTSIDTVHSVCSQKDASRPPRPRDPSAIRPTADIIQPTAKPGFWVVLKSVLHIHPEEEPGCRPDLRLKPPSVERRQCSGPFLGRSILHAFFSSHEIDITW